MEAIELFKAASRLDFGQCFMGAAGTSETKKQKTAKLAMRVAHVLRGD